MAAPQACSEIVADAGYASDAVYTNLAKQRDRGVHPAATKHAQTRRRPSCSQALQDRRADVDAAIDRITHGEGAIAELKRHGATRARCRGTAKLQIQLLLAATAINLKRLTTRLAGRRRTAARTTTPPPARTSRSSTPAYARSRPNQPRLLRQAPLGPPSILRPCLAAQASRRFTHHVHERPTRRARVRPRRARRRRGRPRRRAASTAGTSRTPRARRERGRLVEALGDERSPAPLSTARGCISHAAAAIRTLSGTLEVAAAGERLAERGQRERRPCGRSAWRRSRRASRSRCRTGTARGQRTRLQAAARGVRAMRSKNASRSVSQRQPSAVGAPAGRRQHRDPLARRPAASQDALGGEVRLRAGRGRSRTPAGSCRTAQPWMSQPSASRAASMTASDSVGWPWTMRATSPKPPSSARTLTSSWMSSVARVPTMWPPSSSPYVLVADDLHEAGAVAVDRAGADGAVLQLADDDVVAGVVRLLLGQPEARRRSACRTSRAGCRRSSIGCVCRPAASSAAMMPSSEALCASAGPGTRSPIA